MDSHALRPEIAGSPSVQFSPLPSLPDYLMEDPREKRRLADKVNPSSWVERYLSRYCKDGIGILDVGCGPGVIASEVARRVPDGTVCAVDISADRLAEAEKNLSQFKNARVELGSINNLPFPSDTFDLVYCRFLLEYVERKEAAVQELVRVCRPGGRVVLQDLDGQLVWHYPQEIELEDEIHRVIACLEKSGFDPYTGRKLFSFARAAALSNIEVSIDPYHLFAGSIDPFNYELWDLKLEIALPILQRALGDQSAAKSLKDRFLNYLQDEDTLTYSVLFTVTGEKGRADRLGKEPS